METNIRFTANFAAVFLCMLMLSACAQGPVGPVAGNGQTEEVPGPNGELPARENGVAAPTKDGNLVTAENEYIRAAVANKDVSYCAKLSSEELKNECSELVADAVIMEEAVKSMDATKCDAIQKTETKDLCRVQVDIATMDAEKVAEKNQQLSDNEMIFVEAQDKQDVGKCDQIVNDESKKQACKDGVYSILAAKEQNKEYCAKIVNGEQRELCESGF